MPAAPAPRIPALIERLTPDVVYGAFPEEALGEGLAATHGHLVPGGLLRETDAAGLARAGEAARAFAAVTIAPPDSLVAAIAADAGDLVTRARVGVATA